MTWGIAEARKVYPGWSTQHLRTEVAPNLFTYEVLCHCGCGARVVTRASLYLWTAIRLRVGCPIPVNSFCRCSEYNDQVYRDAGIALNPHSLHVADRPSEGAPPMVMIANAMTLKAGAAMDLGWPTENWLNRVNLTRLGFRSIVGECVYSGGHGVYSWGDHADTGEGANGLFRRW